NVIASPQLKKGINARVSVTVKNTGKQDGEEVAQLYLTHQNINSKAPVRALKGFQRFFLKAGQSKVVTFVITPEQLSLVGEDGRLYQPTGKINVSIGGGQPSVKNITTSNVISKEIKVW
ncbi:MAG TPA: fibronectin type III-like domain-contianing protein, partial [Syntrophorhabdaceae bacterium]|nr:fibronectin type III-like domain-contianing protein [Syntrophorhabdaceae bacterium]